MPALLVAESAQPEPPAERSRRLVVDVYASRAGAPVTDLQAADFELLEDGVAQRVERVQWRPRPEPSPNGSAPAEGSRRLVLFVDGLHAVSGTSPAQQAASLLDGVVQEGDRLAVMTTEMSARNLAWAPVRSTSDGGTDLELTDSLPAPVDDPREAALRACYSSQADGGSVAGRVIARRREDRVLRALGDLVDSLERDSRDRTFVLVASAGWQLFTQDEALGGPARDRAAGQRRPARQGARAGGGSSDPEPPKPAEPGAPTPMAIQSCERERAMLAFADHAVAFRRLWQRANRANVSFYPVRVVSRAEGGAPQNSARWPAGTLAPAEAASAADREESLREMAAQTDGVATLSPEEVAASRRRLAGDLAGYYLLTYLPSNAKLDGRFRQLTIRSRQPDVDIRGRLGYLAQDEASRASARVDALMNGAAPGHRGESDVLPRVLSAVRSPGGTSALRAFATGADGFIWVTAELDPAVARRPEWMAGGQVRVSIEHERGDVAPLTIDAELGPGQRTVSLARPEDRTLVPGRYVIRVQVSTPAGAPLQATVNAQVREPDALLAAAGLPLRRGPSTGLEFQPTADPRFRRTERLRLSVPRYRGTARYAARLENRAGQVLPLAVSLAEEEDRVLGTPLLLAELALAPLAQGEYVLYVEASTPSRTDRLTYTFRIVP